jgi:hypothetical protein
MNNDSSDKEDRRERYNRRHGHAQDGVDTTPQTRRPPYKRQQPSGNEYLEDLEDDWFGYDPE